MSCFSSLTRFKGGICVLAFGYAWDSGAERLQVLREASLVCTRDELNELIAMLQSFRDRDPSAEEGDHQHWRDWCMEWNREHSDVILFVADEPWTKENRG